MSKQREQYAAICGKMTRIDPSQPKKLGTVHTGAAIAPVYDDRRVRKLGGEGENFPTSQACDRIVICARQSGGLSPRDMFALLKKQSKK